MQKKTDEKYVQYICSDKGKILILLIHNNIENISFCFNIEKILN